MKNNILLLVLLQIAGAYSAFGQNKITEQIHFDHDSFVLTEEAKSQLDRLVTKTETVSKFQYQLKGHTDSDGSLEYNQELSKNRCQSVQQYLITKGIKNNYININFFGELIPILDNNNEVGKSKNRRVEIVLNYTPIQSNEELFSYFEQKKVQEYEIDPTISTTVETNEGTILIFPEDTYTFADGSPLNGHKVDLKIDDATKPSAMAFYRLNTAHENTALSTGGMIRLDATADGRRLKMKPGKSVEVFVPTEKVDPNMNLYRGKRNESGTMDWAMMEEKIETKEDVSEENFDQTISSFSANNMLLGNNNNILDNVLFQSNNFINWESTSLAKQIFDEVYENLDKIVVTIPEKPEVDKNFYLEKIVTKPVAIGITKPRLPRKPTYKKAIPPKNIFQKMSFNKKKEQEKLDAYFEKRMAKYEVKLAKYKEKLTTYNAKKSKFDLDFKAWKAYSIERDSMAKSIRSNYMREVINYEAAVRLKRRINILVKNKSINSYYKFLVQNVTSFAQYSNESMALKYKRKNHLSMSINNDTTYTFDIRSGVEWRTRSLFRETIDFENLMANKQLEVKAEANETLAKVSEDLKYYGFEIKSADVFWCNIDTPLPEGKQLAIFNCNNSNFHGSEIFAFRPTKKTVNYITSDMRKQIMFDDNDEINYVAFQFQNKKPLLAQGNFTMNKRTTEELEFMPSSVEEIELAIKALDN